MLFRSSRGAHARPTLRAWIAGARREVALQWAFVGRDMSTTVVPANLFLLAAWGSLPANDLATLVGGLLRGLLYFWCYILVFCITNQIAGLDEDRRNKPDRPLPAGRVSIRGAYQRWVLASIAFVLLGWWWHVLPWALLWWGVATLHNLAHAARFWVLKHSIMLLGVIAQLAAAWALVAPLTAPALRFIGVVAGGLALLMAAQDLRDMDGDAVIGRRTLPLVLGSARTRMLLAWGFGSVPLLIGVLTPLPLVWPVLVAWSGCTGMSWYVGWRFWRGRTVADDRHSYMLFTYWYCAMLASSVLIFAR